MLSECDGDWTALERVCSDRDGSKKYVTERMIHLNKWEMQYCHSCVRRPNESMTDRNEISVVDLVCRHEGCEKVC